MFDLALPSLISRAVTLVIAFTVHEFAHAWSADYLGDDTPRLNGRLTLNPLSHLDPIGSLMLLISGFGWARPVPINPLALQRRSPAGVMLVSAAGPASNLLLAILASLPFQAGALELSLAGGTRLLPTLPAFLLEFIFINLILFFFNLIPIAPLDGEKVAAYFLPASGQQTLYRLRPYGPLMLMALIFIGPRLGLNIFQWLVGWPASLILRLLVT
jgi:Zn-dependent protease